MHRLLTAFTLLCACSTSIAAAQSFNCTPIKAGCVCKTVADFGCSDMSQLQSAIVGKMNSLSGEQLVRFKGGVVRLVFHDAAEYNFNTPPFADGSPAYRSDGCIDQSFHGNVGLDTTINALDALWTPFCSRISRADFWYFAATAVIHASTPYVTPGDPARHITNWMLPFFVGRVDRASCPTVGGTSMLPDGEGGANEIKRSMIDNLGLDIQHSVALIGAHCIGGASESGYVGHWTVDPDKFTSHFFQSLMLWGFIRTARPGGLQQYNIDQKTSATPAATTTVFMMNTDMALFYDVDHFRDSKLSQAQQNKLNECGPPPPQKPVADCPFTKDTTSMDFEQWVRAFADDSGSVVDEPGANKFLFAFARALTYIGQNGYGENDLRCMRCTPAICTDSSCNTEAVQCGLNNKFVSPRPTTTTTLPPTTTTTTTTLPPTTTTTETTTTTTTEPPTTTTTETTTTTTTEPPTTTTTVTPSTTTTETPPPTTSMAATDVPPPATSAASEVTTSAVGSASAATSTTSASTSAGSASGSTTAEASSGASATSAAASQSSSTSSSTSAAASSASSTTTTASSTGSVTSSSPTEVTDAPATPASSSASASGSDPNAITTNAPAGSNAAADTPSPAPIPSAAAVVTWGHGAAVGTAALSLAVTHLMFM